MSRQDDEMTRIRGDELDSLIPSEDWLPQIKEVINDVRQRVRRFWAMRFETEDQRYTRWQGQSSDGKQWSENKGEDAFPFDGSSDSQVRLADTLINEEVRLCLLAQSRASVRLDPRNSPDAALRKEMALTYYLSKIENKWIEEWTKLCNYVHSDSPGIGIMRVWWERRLGMDVREIDISGLQNLYVMKNAEATQQAGMPVDEAAIQAAAAEFTAALMDKDAGEDALVEMLQGAFPDLKVARARKVVRQIREDGKAEFPIPVVDYEGPMVQACRLGDDFHIRDTAIDFQKVTPICFPTWLTRAELESKETTDGWSREFIDDVLTHEGEANFPEYDMQMTGTLIEITPATRRGLYQTVHVMFIGVTEDGYPGRYECMLHMSSDKSAYGRRMLRDKHGDYPFEGIRREVIDKWLMDSRGMTEIIAPAQGNVKTLTDGGVDNATMGSLPPFKTKGYPDKGNLYLAPMDHLGLPVSGDADFLRPPEFPRAAIEMRKLIMDETLRYWGHPAGDGAPDDYVTVANQFKVMWWLLQVKAVIRKIMMLVQQYASDDVLSAIDTDANGKPMIKERKDIQGQFDCSLIFDPDELDLDRMEKKGNIMAKLLMPLDGGKGTVDFSMVAANMARALQPQIARSMIRSNKAADESERADEVKNYKDIRAGLVPQMATDGSWNYQLRRAMYDEMAQQDPTVFDDMAPQKRQNLQQWLAGLEFQAEQHGANVQIGRTGVKETAGMQAPAAGQKGQ